MQPAAFKSKGALSALPTGNDAIHTGWHHGCLPAANATNSITGVKKKWNKI